MAALFLGRRKDIKKAASGPITEQVSGEQHNCCSVIGNLQNLKKLQNIFYDGNQSGQMMWRWKDLLKRIKFALLEPFKKSLI